MFHLLSLYILRDVELPSCMGNVSVNQDYAMVYNLIWRLDWD